MPTVRYEFQFSLPQHELNFHAHYLHEVSENELIFKLYLYGGRDGTEEIRAANSNWSFSKIAGAAYAYSPAGEAGTVVSLKPFRSIVPVSRAVIEPVRWRGMGASPHETLGDVLAIHANRAHATTSSVSLTEVIVMSRRERVRA